MHASRTTGFIIHHVFLVSVTEKYADDRRTELGMSREEIVVRVNGEPYISK